MDKKDETYIPALRYRWLGLLACTAGDRVRNGRGQEDDSPDYT